MLCESHYNSRIGILHCICLQVRESNLRLKQLESDITFHIGKQEAELALRVNSAAFHGDLYQLKGLVRAGADLNKTDYDGRSPLVGIGLSNYFSFNLSQFLVLIM